MNVWLIELRGEGGNLTGLCLGPAVCRPDYTGWRTAEPAIRFARKEDAEAAIRILVHDPCLRLRCEAVEHQFGDPAEAEESAPMSAADADRMASTPDVEAGRTAGQASSAISE